MSELDELEAELKRRTDPVVTVPELADDLGQSDTHVRDNLKLLQRVGAVDSKDVGARATAWWHEERVTGPVVEPDSRETARDTRRETPDADDAVSGENGDGFGGVDFPATRDRSECVEAVEAAREYIREHGGATMRELVAEVMPDHPVGYDAEKDIDRINDPDERNRSTWWRKVIRPGLQADPDVSKPPTGGSRWAWDGER